MSSFMRGVISAICGMSLYQDMLGKEKYLRMAEIGWLDSQYSVPLALGMLIVCLFSKMAEPTPKYRGSMSGPSRTTDDQGRPL